PAFVPQQSFLGQARDEENAVLLDAGPAGSLGLVGRGAGSLPTASAILADVREIASGRAAAAPPLPAEPHELEDDPTPLRHYLRAPAGTGPTALRAQLLTAGVPLESVMFAPGDVLQLVTAPVPTSVVRGALARSDARRAVHVVVRDGAAPSVSPALTRSA